MHIHRPTISARRIDDVNWEFTVNYTANFLPHEVGVRFLDAIKIWEWDDSDHDELTAYGNHEEFNPPTNSIQRQKRILVNSGTLDTELGGEEIRAQIWLGAIPVPPGNRVEEFTPIIGLSP
jgi:hypothetical protein